jgi:hypothetical protein
MVVVASGLFYALLFRPYDRLEAPEGDAHLAHLEVPVPAEGNFD